MNPKMRVTRLRLWRGLSVALLCGGLFLPGCTGNQTDQTALVQEKEEIDRLRKENQDLSKLRNENEEVQRLRKENQEIFKLRAQYQELLRLRKENEQLKTQLSKAQPSGK